MGEWIKFMPGKEHIGLRARFRKVIEDNVEEAVGNIVDNPDPYPWHYGVELECEDGRRLPFMNGTCPFYYDKDGRRHYLAEVNVEYYYSPIDKPLCRDGYSVMVVDELTELKDGKLQRVCRCGGKSYAKAGAIIDMLFEDADRVVEGVRKAAPRLLADQIGREN